MERQELIQVKIELGHKAWCRKQPTRDGFTHDWVMFVRGPDNSDVSHFVEKVVFFLHESFSKPKRGKCRVFIQTCEISAILERVFGSFDLSFANSILLYTS